MLLSGSLFFVLVSAALFVHQMMPASFFGQRSGPFRADGPAAGLKVSSVISLGSMKYLIDTSARRSVPLQLSPDLQPATVLHLPDGVSEEAVKRRIDHFDAVDDVFSHEFLGLLIVYAPASAHDKCNTTSFLQSLAPLATQEVHCLEPSGPLTDLPEGPYFATSNVLSPTWRLFPDTNDAFMVSSVRLGEPATYTPLSWSSAATGRHIDIAVPSRLYSPPSSGKPLNGLRVGVKDNINLSGIKTTGSCRAYHDTYLPAYATAPALQRLIDLGAVIVGKTGLSQFADAEDPTGDYVDYLAAFNPRGDGYRSPGGSSSGSGAAVAAYDWLDFAIGTDTGGSVRVPAAYQGVFGFRPSRENTNVDGSLVIHREIDAIGPISRKISTLKLAARSWVSELTPQSPRKATRLLYPTDRFPVEDFLAQAEYDNLVSAMENLLGVKREEISFQKLWQDYSKEFTTDSFEEYFKPVLMDYVSWGSYHERGQFRSDYEAKFGKAPYVNPVTQYRWRLGSNMTAEGFEGTRAKRHAFQIFIEHVFPEDSVMVTPFLFGEPDTRDVYRNSPSERDPAELALGFRPAFQAPFAGQPEAVFPIAQLPVSSAISRKTEYYAVMASIIGRRGSDMMVLETVEEVLKGKGFSTVVNTGSTPFQVG